MFVCKWFQVIKPGAKDPDFWYWKNQFYPAEDGEGCCSETSIALHYLTSEQVSISFNFFEQVFHTKVLFADFLTIWAYNFFLQQEIGTKVARKMLVTLTTGVNFINI